MHIKLVILSVLLFAADNVMHTSLEDLKVLKFKAGSSELRSN